MTQYMKINNMKGNVTTKGYEGCVNIHGLSHMAIRGVLQKVGSSSREIGVLNLRHVEFQKEVDSASSDLWHYFFSGESIPELTITRCHLNDGTAEWQSKITLHDVMVANIQENTNMKGAGEVVELAFSKIERSYRNQNSSGQWQTPKRVSYDIPSAKMG